MVFGPDPKRLNIGCNASETIGSVNVRGSVMTAGTPSVRWSVARSGHVPRQDVGRCIAVNFAIESSNDVGGFHRVAQCCGCFPYQLSDP